MSHAATKWAFDQPEIHRDMKPSEWAVLMVLADCHNPINGCFPSQDFICSKTNLAERAVRDQLAKLRERNLIRWDEARESGRRGSNRYRLAFERDFQPANSAGSSTGEIEQVQPANFDTNNRQNLPPNLVREPVTGTIERESAGEGEEKQNRNDEPEQRKACNRAHRQWPTYLTDSEPEALAKWMGLTPEQRLQSVDRMSDYVEASKIGGRKAICSFATYLREQRWEKLPEKTEQVKSENSDAPPFGSLWAIARFKQLVSGPKVPFNGFTYLERQLIAEGKADEHAIRLAKQAKTGWPMINRMDEQASMRQGVMVSASLEAFKQSVGPVPVKSDLWNAWKEYHDDHGWPWMPDPGNQPVAYFPVGGPEGLERFKQAILGNDHDGNR